MDKDVYSIILSCLNDARHQGWDRSRLVIRCGIAVIQHLEREYTRFSLEEPSKAWTEGKVWGCPFNVEVSLPRNQIVVVSPDGVVVSGAYVAL